MVTYDINTISDLEDFYSAMSGEKGSKGLQKYFGKSQPWASRLKTRGLPTGYHGRIILDLVIAGKTWNPELFGLEQHPGAAVLNRIVGSGAATVAAE